MLIFIYMALSKDPKMLYKIKYGSSFLELRHLPHSDTQFKSLVTKDNQHHHRSWKNSFIFSLI